MKIFFDARMISHPGIGRYIKCLLAELRRKNELELNILGDRKLIEEYLGFKEGIFDFNYPIYSLQEQAGFLRLKKVVENNVLHVPHYNIPILVKFNLVATIHDLIHIVYPQGASKKFASVYMKFMIEKTLKSAKKIISVSNSTKDSLGKVYGLDNTNIRVIPEGVDEVFTRIEDTRYLRRIKETYKLPDKFILYVGSIRRHKNIKVLLETFLKLTERINDVHLVMVGKLSHPFNLKKKRIIHFNDIASDNDLAAIYNLSSAFCNLSLHEGFSLTILEAQKCGVPVVCSNISTHIETGGDGIFAVAPSDINQIEAALYAVLTDYSLRAKLIRKGLENVYRFSWINAAQQTTAIYKELIDY
jgi:glycosyltransferase involved in cell wall biosynthesis